MIPATSLADQAPTPAARRAPLFASVAYAVVALALAPSALRSLPASPEIDGDELARGSRDTPRRRLVSTALGGDARPADRERAIDAGSAVHLTTPVDPEPLVAVVDEAVSARGAVS